MSLSATKITPNLIVSSVEGSLAFYEDVLGFTRAITVPEQSPFVFASVTSGPVEIFFNDRNEAAKDEHMGALALGGGNTMFIEIEGVDAAYARIAPRAKVVMPILTQWYGMREFSIADPDGYVITFAERVATS